MVMRRAAARSGEWAQHFSNASCSVTHRLYVLVSCTPVDLVITHPIGHVKNIDDYDDDDDE